MRPSVQMICFAVVFSAIGADDVHDLGRHLKLNTGTAPEETLSYYNYLETFKGKVVQG